MQKDVEKDANSPQQQTSESQSQLSEKRIENAEPGAPPLKAATAPTALEWDGPDDPGNPKNWSRWRKLYAIGVPALISFVVTFGTSVYSAFVPRLMEHFHMSSTVAIVGLTLYTLGLVLGPLLGAPISETYGRKAVFLYTFPIAMLFNMGSGLSNTKAGLFVCRFFAGTFGSPALAIGAGTVADLFDLKTDGGPAAAFFIMMPFLGPGLGPFLGGYIQTLGNKWFAWLLLIISAPVLLLTLFLRETYKPIILAKRAKERGLPLPPRPPPKVALKVLATITLIRPLQMIFTEPIVGLMSLYTGFVFGVMFIFFEGYPVSFEEAYGFSIQQVGLTFIALGLGVVLGASVFVIFDRTIYKKQRLLANNNPEPEHRLYAAMFGAIWIPIGIFWFSWSTSPSVHWISPVLAGLFFGMGNVCIFISIMTYIIDVYQAHTGASAAAANGIVRYLLGAVFPLFAFQMYRNLGRHWAGSLLGFITVLLMPLPYVFFKYGKQIRKRSKYATN